MCATPKRAIPSSSGNGEAIIKAPKSGESHLKKPFLKKCRIFFALLIFKTSIISSENLSLTKRNITISPKIEPRAPQNATTKGEVVLAISARDIEAGAIVKADVKNTPDIKLPSIFASSFIENKLCRTPKRTNKIAIRTLTAIRDRSLSKFT